MEPTRNKGGRPPGALGKLAREAIDNARNTGLLPHEILLDMARGNPQPIYEIDEKGDLVTKGWHLPDHEQRRDAAKAAAPYYAPKISTVEVTGNMDDEELDRLIAGLATEAGIALGTGREGTQSTHQEGARADGGGSSRTRVRVDAT
jgi:hypothetical protein